MDAVDLDLRLVIKQNLGNCQPPADGRERLLQAAAQLRQAREALGANHPTRSNEPISPLVRTPLLSAEKGWG